MATKKLILGNKVNVSWYVCWCWKTWNFEIRLIWCFFLFRFLSIIKHIIVCHACNTQLARTEKLVRNTVSSLRGKQYYLDFWALRHGRIFLEYINTGWPFPCFSPSFLALKKTSKSACAVIKKTLCLVVNKVWAEMCRLPQIPLANKSIFSGSLFQYLEENKKWRNRFLFVPDSYNIDYYDSKAVRGKTACKICLFDGGLIHCLTC